MLARFRAACRPPGPIVRFPYPESRSDVTTNRHLAVENFPCAVAHLGIGGLTEAVDSSPPSVVGRIPITRQLCRVENHLSAAQSEDQKMNCARDFWARFFPCLLTVILGLIISALSVSAQTFTVVHDFGAANDAASPTGALMLGPRGSLYGASQTGGTLGWGTIFEVDPSGQEGVLYSFQAGSDGELPSISFLDHGSIVGTTYEGGFNQAGTVFELDSMGGLNVLFSCCTLNQNVGRFPGGAIRGADLNLYVAMFSGGTGACYPTGCGTIVELDQNGSATLVHTFGEVYGDGEFPSATLVRDASGNLYGATRVGGASGYGTIFKLSPGGDETLLYSFRGGADGAIPSDGLLIDQNGNFYGATSHGGIYGSGTVFEVTEAGEHLVLYNFKGSDGAQPIWGVTMDSQGNLYGAASQGGAYNKGTIFKLKPNGQFTVLHDFTGESDGAFPESVLLANGALYGITYRGGAYRWGTLFRLLPTGRSGL